MTIHKYYQYLQENIHYYHQKESNHTKAVDCYDKDRKGLNTASRSSRSNLKPGPQSRNPTAAGTAIHSNLTYPERAPLDTDCRHRIENPMITDEDWNSRRVAVRPQVMR